MNLLEIIQLSLVLLVALPAAIIGRNFTALALALSWLFAWVVWQLAHVGIAIQVLLIGNLAVIAAIYCKPDWQPSSSFWLERSPWDRAILASYPVVWFLYLGLLTPQLQYWGLWLLFAAQVLLAGGETLTLQLAKRKANEPSGPVRRSNRADLHWSWAEHGQ